jgi:RHS repeat-associated protein
MKISFLVILMVAILTPIGTEAGCSNCGGSEANISQGGDIGPVLKISLGGAQYGQSAGSLTFSRQLPDPAMYTPAALQFNSTRPDVVVITINEAVTNIIESTIETNASVVTNVDSSAIYYVITDDSSWESNTNANTNVVYQSSADVVMDDITTFSNSSDFVFISYTNTGTYITAIFAELSTNITYGLNFTVITNYDYEVTTNPVIRQVSAPQALADIPTPPTANGYVINFYFPSQITGYVSSLYQVTGAPFMIWTITNSNPSTINQLQISENNLLYSSLKQWNYTYSAAAGSWSMQSLGGIQENMTNVNLNAGAYQIIDTMQYSGGPVVQRTKTTYQIFNWTQSTNVAVVTNAVGSDSAPQLTTYTYWDPATFGAGSLTLPKNVTHPDGSWEYYAGYTTNGQPTNVYSSFADVTLANYSNGRQTVYVYDPGAADVSASGDDGSISPNVARLTTTSVQNNEISRSYTVFPSVSERLDIQCTAAGAAWNDSGNLITTNLFYTSGPNQFALQAVIRPDGTMTTYNYITNSTGTYKTNITVTGQPNSTCTYVVDGVSNVTVLNLAGNTVFVGSYDVVTGIPLSQDVYGNFDNYGRSQQVTHLDGTTEYNQYACCGLNYSSDRDGVTNVYVYDTDQRLLGNIRFYNNQPITYEKTLDATGRPVQSYRIGSDNSTINLSQSAYDLAGELIAQTNALGGGTLYSRANDPVTGGVIQTIVYPNGGTCTNFYYADGSLKAMIGTAVHGITNVIGVENVSDVYQLYSQEIKLNADGSPSSEWTKTYTDMAGRPYKTVYASASGTPVSISYYNSRGQLTNSVDPDGVSTLYDYNAKGELAHTAIHVDSTAGINFGGNDRITWTTNDVTTDHGANVRRTRTYAWLANGMDSPTVISTVENSTDGLNMWQTQYRDASTPVTTTNQTGYSSNSRSVTNTAPDGSYTINAYSYGRLASSTRYDSTHAQIGGTTYGYDAHGRQGTVTDARNGATTYGYNNADLVATNTTPAPGAGQSAETTITLFDNSLHPYSVIQPDGMTVSNIYLLTGELGLQFGSRTYPVAYSYDYAGHMNTMTNWSNFNGGSGTRVTTWNYDSYRGFLTGTTYDGGVVGPSYTYTAAGRLASRAWARGITTTYGYDNSGGLTTIVYSDGKTANVTNVYDRLGRRSIIACNGITNTLAYNLANELVSESYSNGILNGLSVTNGYDADLRRTSVALNFQLSTLGSATYGYDAASRLSTVTDGTNNSAAYSYLANSPLVSQITFKQSGTTRMTTTKSYDYLNRLTSISSQPSASGLLPVAFNYNYNPANQRTKDTLVDGSYWVYGYDSLGQVTNGCKYFADGTPVAGQQFDYTFDTIGNRTQTMAGGNQTGANLRVANYTNNSLNQITSRDVPTNVDIMGASILTNLVTVNGQTAYRKEEYFRQQLSANNSSSALWMNIIVSGGQSVTGNVYVAQTPEQFGYDADGNLTNDGRFNYIWDGENRLINLTSLPNAPMGSKVKLDFAYDYQGRRIQKIVSTNYTSGTNYTAQYTNRFVYDGWNLIAILNSQSSIIESFVWGNDLSGSQQGAGGVGGLLEVSYYGSGTTNCFAAYDGNGNAAALINAADGTTLANYEYGPFGEVIRSTGTMAKNNPFRFSTKYQDDESDLLYYGYRYNKPSTGTWPNRDPLGEEGGVNLYGFIGNNPVNQFDELGLMKWADVVAKQKEVEAQVSKIKCCCNKPGPTRAFETIAGMASGETVTETATVDTHGCVLTIWSYFWWNCFRAQREAWWIFPGGPGWPDGWKEYGWEEGGPTDTESHAGKVPGGKRNSNQWNWNAAIIFTVCGADGHVHAFLVPSNESMWNWDPGTKSWTQ